jgi:hypothetical protein
VTAAEIVARMKERMNGKMPSDHETHLAVAKACDNLLAAGSAATGETPWDEAIVLEAINILKRETPK